MCNLIEYSDGYSNTWRRLWQYYKAEQAPDNNNINDFPLITVIVFRSNLNSK